MPNKIKLLDDNGHFLYSWLFTVEGANLDLLSGQELGSLAGTPRRINVTMDYPNVIASNPARKLSKDKQYKVIILESDLSEEW